MPFISAQPPPAMTESHQWVLDSPVQLRSLRDCLHQAITGQPLPAGAELDEIPEKVALVATELATNALRHGLPPTIVRLGRHDRVFVLDVADHSPEVVPHYVDDRPPGAGGLGLRLAHKLAFDLGWYIENDTKHVWAEFPVPTSG